MNITPETYIERLLQASNKKLDLLLDILALTKEQAESITEEGMGSLEKLTGDKQTKIDQINKLDEEFNVYFQRLKQQLGVKSLEELQNPGIKGVAELKQSVGKIMTAIKEISTLEQHNNAKAKALLDQLGQEVRKINQGKRVSNAYSPGNLMQPPSYFIDKKE